MPFSFARRPQGVQDGGNLVTPASPGQDADVILDLSTRYWVSVVLIFPLALIELRDILPIFKQTEVAVRALKLAGFILSTPVVIWCGKPLFSKAWRAIKDRKPDAFTALGICAGATYLYSVASLFLQTMFTGSLYFGAAAMLVTLALFWRLHELTAGSREAP